MYNEAELSKFITNWHDSFLKVVSKYMLYNLKDPPEGLIDDIMAEMMELTPNRFPIDKRNCRRAIKSLVQKYPVMPLTEMDIPDNIEGIWDERVIRVIEQIKRDKLPKHPFSWVASNGTNPVYRYEDEGLTYFQVACKTLYTFTEIDCKVIEADLDVAGFVLSCCLGEEDSQHYTLTYLIAYLLCSVDALYKKIEEADNKVEKFRRKMEDLRSRPPIVQVVERPPDEARLNQLIEENAKLKDEMHSYKMKIEHQVSERFDDLLLEKDIRIDELEKLVKELREAQPEIKLDNLGIELPKVPTENVCFICGHEDTTRYVQSKYPSWIPFTSKSSVAPPTVQYGIVYAPYVAHSMVERFKKFCFDAKILYVNSSNIARMEQEIQMQLLG